MSRQVDGRRGCAEPRICPDPSPPRGRPPKWCSPTCRHRAWEQRRAASSGLAAVEIIERAVETVKVETHHVTETIEVPIAVQPHTVTQFTTVLTDLAHRLDTADSTTETCRLSRPALPPSWKPSSAAGDTDSSTQTGASVRPTVTTLRGCAHSSIRAAGGSCAYATT